MAHSEKPPLLRHYLTLFECGSSTGLSDGELLARFVDQEDEAAELAFSALVERHASRVLRICRAVTRNEHDAEDAFQATFLLLATKSARLRVRDSLGPWLAEVARRVSKTARATALARTARELRASKFAVTHEPASESSGDIASIVNEELDRLPERYRLPLLLCDMQSQTHEEAARRLGWPLGTVKSRQSQRPAAVARPPEAAGTFPAPIPMTTYFSSAQVPIAPSLIRSTVGRQRLAQYAADPLKERSRLRLQHSSQGF